MVDEEEDEEEEGSVVGGAKLFVSAASLNFLLAKIEGKDEISEVRSIVFRAQLLSTHLVSVSMQ